jgi:hypothetical protein
MFAGWLAAVACVFGAFLDSIFLSVRTSFSLLSFSIIFIPIGHNLPDGKGSRYCINLVCIAGHPSESL